MKIKTLTPVDHNNYPFPEGTVLDLEEHEAQALISCGAAQELDKDSEEIGIKIPPGQPYTPAPMPEQRMTVKTSTPVQHNNQLFPEDTILDLEEHEAQALISYDAAQALDKDSKEIGAKVPPGPEYTPDMSDEAVLRRKIGRGRASWAKGSK